jgi:FkbM family methyltransferase
MIAELFTKSRRAFALLVRDRPLFVSKLKAAWKRLSAPTSGTLPLRIQNVIFQCDFDLDPNVREMFVGNYEPEIARLFRRLLNPGDVVVDAGANIGYFSAVALSLVGTRGQVHAFEPAPAMYRKLLKLRDDNPQFVFEPNNCALGDHAGELPLAVTNRRNIGWNTLVPEFMDSADIGELSSVPIRRLDDYLSEKKIDAVRLIKIDTEGFEFPVLKGLTGFLRKTQHRPFIVVEVVPQAYPKLQTTLAQLEAFLGEYGYVARDLEDRETLSLPSFTAMANVLLAPRSEVRAHVPAPGT